MQSYSPKSPEQTGRIKKVFSPEAKAKRRQFKAKFNIDKEQLNEKDIISIMTAIGAQQNEKIDVEALSKKLMNKLDTNNNGFVKTNDLIEEIVNRNEALIEDEFSEFYKKINQILQSKSEDIIKKLRILQQKKWVIDKQTFVPLIENIINTIAEENFYDLENQIIDFSKNEGEKFIIKYSQMEDTHRKEQDFAIMRNTSLKYTTKSSFSSFSSPTKKKKKYKFIITNITINSSKYV